MSGARAAARDSKALASGMHGVGKGGRAAAGGVDRYGRSARGAERHTRGLGRGFVYARKGLGPLRTGVTGLTGALGFGAGIGLIGALAAGGKATVEFDRSMRNVNSIAQLTPKRLQSVQDSVLDLAGKSAQAPKTLAAGLYDIVSSGFSASDGLKILAASAKAATAGLTTTDVSTKAVTAVLNAYHLSASKSASVSDTLFQTVNRGVITFEDLASTIGDVLPFASSLHVDLNQVGAAVATMTKAGIGPAETMTRIKNVMVALIKPSEGAKTAFQKLGVESGEQLVKQKGLQGALEALIGTTDGSKASVAKLFPNIRALGGALALTGKNAKTAHGDLAAFKDTSGATDKALREQSKSISFAWDKIKSTVTAAAIRLGSKAAPAVAKFMTEVTDGTGEGGKFRDQVVDIAKAAWGVIKPIGQFVGKVLAFAAAHPGITKAVGALLLLRKLANLKISQDVFTVLGAQLPGGKKKPPLQDLRTVDQRGRLAKLGSRLANTPSVLAGLAVGAQVLADKLDNIKVPKFLTGLKDVVVQGVGGPLKVLRSLAANITHPVKLLRTLGKSVMTLATVIFPAFMIPARIVAHFLGGPLKSAGRGVWSIMRKLGGFIGGAFTAVLHAVIGPIKAVRDALNWIRNAALKAWHKLGDFLGLSGRVGNMKNAMLDLKSAVQGVADAVNAIPAQKLHDLPGEFSASGLTGRGNALGGIIPGYGGGDSVLRWLEPGEGIIRKEAVRARGGRPWVDRMNTPGMQSGGLVAPVSAAAPAGASGAEEWQPINLYLDGRLVTETVARRVRDARNRM